MLEEARPADRRKLQTLMARCREHSETPKKYFQILQGEGVSTLLIADENALGAVKKGSLSTAIVQPEAVETHVEVVTMCEKVRFLKNSIAKKSRGRRISELIVG